VLTVLCRRDSLLAGAAAYGGYPQPYGQPMSYPPPYGGAGYIYPYGQPYSAWLAVPVLVAHGLWLTSRGVVSQAGYPPQVAGPGPPIQTTESGQGTYPLLSLFSPICYVHVAYAKWRSFTRELRVVRVVANRAPWMQSVCLPYPERYD